MELVRERRREIARLKKRMRNRTGQGPPTTRVRHPRNPRVIAPSRFHNQADNRLVGVVAASVIAEQISPTLWATRAFHRLQAEAGGLSERPSLTTLRNIEVDFAGQDNAVHECTPHRGSTWTTRARNLSMARPGERTTPQRRLHPNQTNFFGA